MIPATFDYQDPADARGWDDEDTRVDECVHGSHPIECARCTSAGFIAAVSGEGEDMSEEELDVERERVLDAWIETATLREIKRAEFKLANKVERIRAEAKRLAKELEQFEKPVRKTRSDAGTTRARKEQAA